jgi:hypothetical protein
LGVMLQNSKFNIYSDHGCILLFTKMQPEYGNLMCDNRPEMN